MENLYLFLTLILVSFIQNMAFTWTSRSRNSGDPQYHRYAAWSSNGVWFLAQMTVVKIMWQPLMNGDILTVIIGGIIYIFATTEGSVFMMRLLLGYYEDHKLLKTISKFFKEKNKRKVGEGTDYKTVKIYNTSPFELPEYKTEGSSGMDIKTDLSVINTENSEEYLAKKTKGRIGITYDEDRTLMSDMVATHPVKNIILYPNSRAILPTGIYTEISEGDEVVFRPRSGQSFKKGFSILNAPSTIDEDYKGEWGVIVGNFSDKPILIEHGERVCQMVLQKKSPKVKWQSVKKYEDLTKTERGSGGFGSTGTK